jgi:hypothetical protein
VKAQKTARDELHADVVELPQQLPKIPGREEMQVRRIVVRLHPDEEAQPVLEAKRIRHRAD